MHFVLKYWVSTALYPRLRRSCLQEAVDLPPSQELSLSTLEVAPPHRGAARSLRANGQTGAGPRPQDGEKVGKERGIATDPRNGRRNLRGPKFPECQGPTQVSSLTIKEAEAENGKLRQKQPLGQRNRQDHKCATWRLNLSSLESCVGHLGTLRPRERLIRHTEGQRQGWHWLRPPGVGRAPQAGSEHRG